MNLNVLSTKFLFFYFSFFIASNVIAQKCWKQIDGGDNHNIAIGQDGSMWAWGNNYFGQIGDGNTYTARRVPLLIGIDNTWETVSAGSNFSIGVKKDGTLWTWGYNYNGQLGDGSSGPGIFQPSPAQIGTLNNWRNVSAGDVYAMAIKVDGTLWGWGANDSGQIGNGHNGLGSIEPSPVQIGSDNNWKSVSTGQEHTIAIKSDGTLWAWGDNTYGQLGNGTTINTNTPIQIGTASEWKSVSAGGLFSIAIKTDGTIWGWGNNTNGQLGDGTTIQRNSPVQIGSSTDWINASAATRTSGYVLAVKTDGTLWSWGENTYGQLGDGTNIQRNIPTQIGNEKNWSMVNTGAFHSVAIKTDGSLWTWGRNTLGQLGNGTNISESAPIPIDCPFTPPCLINYWNGTVSTAWEEAGNWSCGTVPEANTEVRIEGLKIFYPVINSNAVCKKLVGTSASSIVVSAGFSLQILGTGQ